MWLLALAAIILATAPARPARAQPGADRSQEVEMALGQYAEAKTPDQRATIVEYLQQLDRKMVAGAVVDHILSARNGTEATAFNDLVESFAPEGCAAVLDRLAKAAQPIPKGKLIVALRHCAGDETRSALESCLADKRPVLFEARGKQPRRVCDLAYDELFLKLRGDSRYGLDASPKMNGIITEKMPVKERDALIAKLKQKLSKKSPSPAPTPPPEPAKPATTSAMA
jgi:hypothetical protein